jgi:V/A-type H+-transporting ATPase subunit K
MIVMFGLVLSFSAVAGTIGLGMFMRKKAVVGGRRMFIVIVALSLSLVAAGALVPFVSPPATAAETGEPAKAPDPSNNGLGYIGMALATGLSCIGAGIAVGSVGAAALGLVGEQPGAIGTTLIYVGLAEGVAIYGILISIMISIKLA